MHKGLCMRVTTHAPAQASAHARAHVHPSVVAHSHARAPHMSLYDMCMPMGMVMTMFMAIGRTLVDVLRSC
eukprot:15434719-Alexandrium_andersonii.AAC.1